MKLLVTGGAGYIGSVVAHQLVEAGHETVVPDNLSKGHRRAIPDGTRFVRCDLLDPEGTRVAVSEGFDGMLHFAALSLVGGSAEQPDLYYRNNVCGTLNLLEAMGEAGEHRVYNLGNGAGFSVRETVEAARAVTGRSLEAVEAPRRAGDPARLGASCDKIRAELGWNPEKPELGAMISDAWDWMHSRPNGYE